VRIHRVLAARAAQLDMFFHAPILAEARQSHVNVRRACPSPHPSVFRPRLTIAD
jgi:hypothetical protein